MKKLILGLACLVSLSACTTAPVVGLNDAQNAFGNRRNVRVSEVVKKFGQPGVVLEKPDAARVDLVYPQVAIDHYSMVHTDRAQCTVFFFGWDQGHSHLNLVSINDGACNGASTGGREVSQENFNAKYLGQRRPASAGH